ncbi:MAG: hypothetical protein ACRDWI_16145 [Jiangellaceae bacterium]
MPPRRKRTAGPTPVEALTHDDKRVNIPTADARDFVDEAASAPGRLLYSRDTSLDPQLVWRGKDVQDAADLAAEREAEDADTDTFVRTSSTISPRLACRTAAVRSGWSSSPSARMRACSSRPKATVRTASAILRSGSP